MHDRDRLRRQLRRRIELGDRRVVPGLDLPEENLGERRAVDHEIAGLDALDVDDRHDAAHDHRKLNKRALVELLAGKRRVRGAEGDGPRFDLLDAAARADRLVVQSDVGLFLVGIGPFRIDRIGKGRSGARYVDCERGPDRGRGDDGGGRQGTEKFQASLLFVRDAKLKRTRIWPAAYVLASLVAG